MKMKASKVIFANLSGVKEYKRLEKLARTYEKLKAENEAKPNQHKAKSMDKLKTEINYLMPDVEYDLNRIMKVYGNAVGEMTEDNEVYSKDNVSSFFTELERMKENVARYKQMVG